MNVHNQMEEYVSDRVRDIYRQLKEKESPWLTAAKAAFLIQSVTS